MQGTKVLSYKKNYMINKTFDLSVCERNRLTLICPPVCCQLCRIDGASQSQFG